MLEGLKADLPAALREHAAGWSAVGETGGAIVVGAISGYAYIFPGDQTENFLVTMTYQVTPPGHSVTKGTGGEWTGAPTYASSETTFTDSGADFQAYMVGWLLQPDVELPSYLEIVEVVSATAIKVKGDADTLATSGSTYRLHAPPGVDRATGALIAGLEESGSHWLWAGYEYVPPMVGFHNPEGQDPGTYGAQPGTNKLGSYHCGNRVYEPATGRWTTPDPAMSPWSNILAYMSSGLQLTDPNGLQSLTAEEMEVIRKWVEEQKRKEKNGERPGNWWGENAKEAPKPKTQKCPNCHDDGTQEVKKRSRPISEHIKEGAEKVVKAAETVARAAATVAAAVLPAGCSKTVPTTPGAPPLPRGPDGSLPSGWTSASWDAAWKKYVEALYNPSDATKVDRRCLAAAQPLLSKFGEFQSCRDLAQSVGKGSEAASNALSCMNEIRGAYPVEYQTALAACATVAGSADPSHLVKAVTP